MTQQLEPHAEGVKRILSELNAKISNAKVTLVAGNAPNARVHPQEVIVYDPTVKSNRGKGHPLLITALCADFEAWPAIHAAFTEEGIESLSTFDPKHPETQHGAVCYASRKTAILLIPDPRNNTGRPVLTSIFS